MPAPSSALFWLTSFVLIAGLLLGGGTRDGFLSDAVLELIALPLLLAALWRTPELLAARQTRLPVLFAVAVAAVPLLQLIPLPPDVWTRLPSRELVAESLAFAGKALGWMPLSVSPATTWVSALSLLAPLAVFLATLQLGFRERRLLSLVAVGVGILSALVGLLQAAQGPQSALRFFAFSHVTDAVGFFANRNHFAALLYSLTLIAAVWIVDATYRVGKRKTLKEHAGRPVAALIGALVCLIVLLGALAMARSRAGLALAIGALIGIFALALTDRRGATRTMSTKLLFGAVALAVVFAVQFTLFRILQRFTVDPLADYRVVMAGITYAAAKTYWPLGSGVGTFVPVYASVEHPSDAIANVYVNHAHNDFLQVWLEAGLVGLALMGLFAIWLIYRLVVLWRGELPGSQPIDRSLARAATIVIVLLIVHSLVDYPLRTAAMMTLFAFACALLVEPVVKASPAEEEASERVPSRQPAAASNTQAWPPAPGPQPGETWADADWPEAWRKPPGS